jgi:foldase protein PrsA
LAALLSPKQMAASGRELFAWLKDPKHIRAVGGLAGLFVVLVVVSILTGGQHVSSNSVAEVNDTQISKATFDHWVNAAARSQQTSPNVVAPDPPTFSRCIAAKQQQPPPPGKPAPSTQDLFNQCKQEYGQFKEQALQFLISSQWVEQEADKRGIHASDADVKAQFEQKKQQAFPDQNAYNQFLATSGQTEPDLLLHVKLSIIESQLRQQIVASGGQVSDSDISNFYNQNKQRFSQPERRDIHVILAKDAQSADQAHKALDQGQDFKQVAQQFSADKSAADTGGALPDVTKGQQEQPLDNAIFSAKPGQVEGPIQTQFGFYVFRVDTVKPPSQQSLQQAHDTIKNQLATQKQQGALTDFVKEFQGKYRSNTLCASSYVVSSCQNGPPPPPVPESG